MNFVITGGNHPQDAILDNQKNILAGHLIGYVKVVFNESSAEHVEDPVTFQFRKVI